MAASDFEWYDSDGAHASLHPARARGEYLTLKVEDGDNAAGVYVPRHKVAQLIDYLRGCLLADHALPAPEQKSEAQA